jgi:co-chaperonin GroES (HSP10)
MRVVGKKILVKQTLTDTVSKGGIVMAGDQQALPFGEVIQLGDGVSEVEVGNLVLFTQIGAIPLLIKKDHVLIEFEDVLAILDEEDIQNVGP